MFILACNFGWCYAFFIWHPATKTVSHYYLAFFLLLKQLTLTSFCLMIQSMFPPLSDVRYKRQSKVDLNYQSFCISMGLLQISKAFSQLHDDHSQKPNIKEYNFQMFCDSMLLSLSEAIELLFHDHEMLIRTRGTQISDSKCPLFSGDH